MPNIEELRGHGLPKAHSFRVYYCDHCTNAHIVLFDESDTPFAQFVIGKLNQTHLIVDTNEVFERYE